MFAKNQSSPKDWQGLVTFTVTNDSVSVSWGFGGWDLAGGSFTATWGVAYSAGSHGINVAISETLGGGMSGQLHIKITTPLGSWTSSLAAGYVGTCYVRMYVSDFALSVNSACNWDFSWASFNAWLSLDGSPETLEVTQGSLLDFGTGTYDERLNCTGLSPFGGPALVCGSASLITCSYPIMAGSTGTGTATIGGGYKWGATGALAADRILLDTSTGGGSCACSSAIPSVTGADSYSVSTSVTWNASFEEGAAVCTVCGSSCPACTAMYAPFTLLSVYDQTSCTIKSRYSGVGDQNIDSTWECWTEIAGMTPTDTMGGSSTTTTMSNTTCASTRTVNSLSATAYCIIAPPTCAGMGGCILPPDTACCYAAGIVLSWPMLPPCTAPSVHALGYDISNPLRHCIVYGDASTDAITMGCAGDIVPQSFSLVSTGITAVWARPRFIDLGNSTPIGLFYGDGSNCYWGETNDEGNTFATTLSMGAGSVGDYDEGRDGNKWFFKLETPDMGTTWNVWARWLDANLNVVRDWTITNLTGVDNEPIACREDWSSDGSWRIGLFYSIGGVETLKYAVDGLTFS